MNEIDVDSFAGGGGASLGIEWATGQSPAIAINHDPEAMAMHAANHRDTVHVSKNIWKVDPLDYVKGRPVRLAWFSPDCKHHSKAKGGRPVKRSIRDLAWVVVLWAKRARPRIIGLENVEEFADWGPLAQKTDANGDPVFDLHNNPVMVPDPERKGETFAAWVKELNRLGYRVEWRELRACDYGSPTIRKRLFLIARRDGKPIVWPTPTHGAPDTEDVLAGRLKPWQTAAQIIDWSLPCPSIFLTPEEVKELGLKCKRPLADKTMARIAKGVQRYIIDAAEPFVVGVGGRAAQSAEVPISRPLGTITAKNDRALVAPFVSPVTHAGAPRVNSIEEPLRTVTCAHRGEHALIAPFLVPRYGERPGQEPRSHAADAPLPTVTPDANCGSLVAPLITKFQQNGCGQTVDDPLMTVMAGAPRFGLVAAFLAQHNTGMVGHDARKPLSTITQRGTHQQVVASHLINMKGSARGDAGIDGPTPTQTAGGMHVGEVRAFLQKYHRDGGQHQDCREPLHTQDTRGRMSVVMVHGEPYAIADIGMRMLTPRELFRAQGFPDSYIIDPPHDGKPLTNTAQIRMCGNSVCPQVAAALVSANLDAEEQRSVA